MSFPRHLPQAGLLTQNFLHPLSISWVNLGKLLALSFLISFPSEMGMIILLVSEVCWEDQMTEWM